MANPNAYLRSRPERQFEQYRPLATLRSSAPSPVPPTFSAAYVGGRVVVTFSRAVLDTPQLRDPASYSITAPAGQPAVSVTDVQVTDTTVSLGIAGDVRGGGTYLVSLAAGCARAADTGEGNAAASVDCTIAPVALSVASAVPLSSTKLRVTFTKPVKQVSAANADDALNPANYSITSAAGALAVSSVATVASDVVDLTTSGQTGIQYELDVSGVEDLAGNAI